MKLVRNLLLLVFIPFTFSACKKDTKVDPDAQTSSLDCNLNTPTFSRTINVTDKFHSVVEDLQRNIVLLGEQYLIKYNYLGDLVWSKKIGLIGTPQTIIQADGDNYFATSSTIDITSQKWHQYYSAHDKGMLSLTSYWRGTFSGPYNNNCQFAYQKVTKDFGEQPDTFVYANKPVNNSKCYLNKFDGEGQLLWSKTFDGNYFGGKNICKTDDGNYALVTLKISGAFYTLDIDEFGIFQDTIKTPVDQNSITVYMLNAKGAILWSRTIDGIIVPGYRPESDLAYTNISVVSVQNNVFVQTRFKLFVLDENGNIIRTMKPYGTTCNTYALGLSAYNNLVYSTGTSYATGNYYGFMLAYDATGNIREQTLSNNTMGTRNIVATSDGIVFINENGMSKTTMNDSRLWAVSVDGLLQCATQTCREGIVYITDQKNKLRLVKTDRNGIY